MGPGESETRNNPRPRRLAPLDAAPAERAVDASSTTIDDGYMATADTSSTTIDLVEGGEASVEQAAADDGALPADAAADDASFWQATVEYNQRRVNREDAANAIATLFSFELKGVGRNINAEPK